MSSKSSRKAGRRKGDARWGEWSAWEWDFERKCYRSERTNTNGDTNYQYGQHDAGLNAQPRSTNDNLFQSSSNAALSDNTNSSQFQDEAIDDDGGFPELDRNARIQTQGFAWSENPNLGATNSKEQNPEVQYPERKPPKPASNFYDSDTGPSDNADPAYYSQGYARRNPPGRWASILNLRSSSKQKSGIQYQEPNFQGSSFNAYGPYPSYTNPTQYPSQNYGIGVFPSGPSDTLNSAFGHITSNMEALDLERMNPFRDQAPGESEGDYELMGNPKGYFKVGRIFKTGRTDIHNQILVVVSERSDSAICCVPDERNAGQEDFPIVLENPLVTVASPLRLNFNEQFEVEHYCRVLNIGRIDRRHLKTLKTRYLKENGGDKLLDEALEDQSIDENGVKVIPVVEEIPERVSGAIRSKSHNFRSIKTKNPEIDCDPLYKKYRVHMSSDFKKGRVFKTLWSEPYGGDASSVSTDEPLILGSKFGERVYSSIRRFAIVKTSIGHCVCVPILTYGRQGTAKRGVKPEHHAIIYTSSNPPSELEGEQKLHKKPIRVTLKASGEELRRETRVNYAKIYTVEHNVKVCFTGEIHRDSKATFFGDFMRVFFDNEEEEEEDEGLVINSNIPQINRASMDLQNTNSVASIKSGVLRAREMAEETYDQQWLVIPTKP